MPKNSRFFQNELTIKKLRAEIQNLKYDRDLLIEESKTFRGILNRRSLNHDIDVLDKRIKQLQIKLRVAVHDQQQNLKESLSNPYEDDSSHIHIQNARVVADSINNLHTEKATMTKIDVKLGDNTTIHGNLVAATSIKDSFNQSDSANISDDLRSILKELAVAVGKMIENLPEESANQVARELESLTNEATSSSPRKKYWELSSEGLKTAAKNVGEIGKPVLELVAKIVSILMAASA